MLPGCCKGRWSSGVEICPFPLYHILGFILTFLNGVGDYIKNKKHQSVLLFETTTAQVPEMSCLLNFEGVTSGAWTFWTTLLQDNFIHIQLQMCVPKQEVAINPIRTHWPIKSLKQKWLSMGKGSTTSVSHKGGSRVWSDYEVDLLLDITLEFKANKSPRKPSDGSHPQCIRRVHEDLPGHM